MNLDLLPMVIATVAAWTATAAILRWGRTLPVYDMPNERSSHTRPTLRLGGLGIAAGLTCGALWLVLRANPVGLGAPTATRTLALGAAAFFVLGLLEDVHHLPEWPRFLAQSAFAATVAAHGLRLHALAIPGVGTIDLSWPVSMPLTILWYAGYVNAFNFMDGTDGIAAGQAVVVGAALWLLGGHPASFLLAAAAFGFLPHNWEPAAIFMGDGGSYMLGFLLAALTVASSNEGGSGRLPFLAAALLSATFLADTLATFVRRVCRRERWFKAHRSHHYQLLTDLGFRHREVAVGNMLLTALMAVMAWAYGRGATGLRLGLLAAAFSVFALLFAGIQTARGRRGAAAAST